MEVNCWGRGREGRERKRSERINYCIICGRRDGCLGRLARTPCKEDEKGPFCIQNGQSGRRGNYQQESSEWRMGASLTQPLLDRKNMPSGLPQSAIVKRRGSDLPRLDSDIQDHYLKDLRVVLVGFPLLPGNRGIVSTPGAALGL